MKGVWENQRKGENDEAPKTVQRRMLLPRIHHCTHEGRKKVKKFILKLKSVLFSDVVKWFERDSHDFPRGWAFVVEPRPRSCTGRTQQLSILISTPTVSLPQKLNASCGLRCYIHSGWSKNRKFFYSFILKYMLTKNVIL